MTLHSPKRVSAKSSPKESSLIIKKVYFPNIFRITNSGTEYYVSMSFWIQLFETRGFGPSIPKVLKRVE